jgi:hypothetical protein
MYRKFDVTENLFFLYSALFNGTKHSLRVVGGSRAGEASDATPGGSSNQETPMIGSAEPATLLEAMDQDANTSGGGDR